MVKDIMKNRYLNRCSCEQLRQRPLTLHIISILKESNKTWITTTDIIKTGRAKYRDWPKDRNTVFRALNTMSRCHFFNEKKQGKGQAMVWGLNKDKLLHKELMVHEIQQLEHVVSRLPHWAFEVDYFRTEIDRIWQKIRTSLADVEKQDVALNRVLFNLKVREIFTSSSYSLLDKQLSIIFLFCLFTPSLEWLGRWFDLSQISYSVKVDFILADILNKHFYPEKTQKELIVDVDKHTLDPSLSKKLEFLIIIYLDTMRLDYEYRYQLFDKNKFSLFEENELEKHSKAISEEKNRLFSEHLEGKSFFLEMMNKWDYKLDEIDQFIDEYKILYLSLNH